MNVYNITIKAGAGNTATYRDITVVTDNFQNASNIGRAKCKYNEQLHCVNETYEDVIIDTAVIKPDSQQI